MKVQQINWIKNKTWFLWIRILPICMYITISELYHPITLIWYFWEMIKKTLLSLYNGIKSGCIAQLVTDRLGTEREREQTDWRLAQPATLAFPVIPSSPLLNERDSVSVNEISGHSPLQRYMYRSLCSLAEGQRGIMTTIMTSYCLWFQNGNPNQPLTT